MKEFHALITNTTSLVGYIAVLMFVGAHLGGDQRSVLDPALMKGSIMEARSIGAHPQKVVIIIDGLPYEATIGKALDSSAVFPY